MKPSVTLQAFNCMISERYDEVNGIRLHILEAGLENKQVIIFLHGFPEFNRAWQAQLDFMATNGFHALAPDQRGYHLSSKPSGIKSYLLNFLVDDIAVWIKQLTTQKIILVGHDWGGAVAWQLAFRYPELLKQLVIINMPHLAVMKQTLKTNPKQILKSWYIAFFQLPLVPELLCQAFNFKFLASSLTKTANKGTFSPQQIEEYRNAWRQPGAINRMINWYRAAKYKKNLPGKISVPTLLIWGKNDSFLNSGMAQSSIEQCTDGKLVMVDDATHWVHHEKPELVSQLILDFIKG